MLDRDAAGLRGPVSICEMEQLDPRFVTRFSFHPDGRWIEHYHRNPDGSTWSVTRRYDPSGRPVREEWIGVPEPRTMLYHYDAAGRLARIDAQPPGAPARVHESILYNADGTSTVTLYVDPPLRDRNVGICTDGMLHMSTDAVSIMTLRDAAGRAVRKVLHDADERVIRRVGFRYDGAGRLVEEGEIEPGGRLRTDFRNHYRYDHAGRCIEVERHWSSFGGQRQAMAYNDRGDVVEERIEWIGADVMPMPPPSSSRYTYEYDANGNWTSRIQEIRDLLSGAIVGAAVTRRALEYA